MRKRARDVMYCYATFASLLAIAANSLADGTHIGLRRARSITVESGEQCTPDDVSTAGNSVASQNDRLSPPSLASGRRNQKKHKKATLIENDAVEMENGQNQELIKEQTDAEVTTKEESSGEEANGPPILELVETATTGDHVADDTCSGADSKSNKASRHRNQSPRDHKNDNDKNVDKSEERVYFDDASADDGKDGAKPEATRRAMKSSKKVIVEKKKVQETREKSAENTSNDGENVRVEKIAVASSEVIDDGENQPNDGEDGENLDNKEAGDPMESATSKIPNDSEDSPNEKRDENDGAAQTPEADDASAQVSTPEKVDDENNTGGADVNDDDDEAKEKISDKHSAAKKKSEATKKSKTDANVIESDRENRRYLPSYSHGPRIHRINVIHDHGSSRKRNKNMNKNMNVNSNNARLGNSRRSAAYRASGKKSRNDNQNYNANVNTGGSKLAPPRSNKGTIFTVIPIRRSYDPYGAKISRNSNVNTNVNRNAGHDAKRYIIREDDDSDAVKLRSRGMRYRGRNYNVSPKGLPHFLE